MREIFLDERLTYLMMRIMILDAKDFAWASFNNFEMLATKVNKFWQKSMQTEY